MLPGILPAGPGVPAPKSPPPVVPASPGPKSPKKKVRLPAVPGATPAAKVQRRLLKRRSSAQPHGPEPAPATGGDAAEPVVDEGMVDAEAEDPAEVF